MPTTTVEDTFLFYEVTGQGLPIVLTTGLGAGAEARAELIAGLAKHHKVLTYDQRGTGRSGPASQPQSIEDFAADIVTLMDAANIDRAAIIGLSTGTGIATTLAANYSNRVSHLILGAPWTYGDADLHVLQNTRKTAARTMPADFYIHFNSMLIYPPEFRRKHFKRFENMAAQAFKSPQDPVKIAARLDAILAFDARELYKKINCPALVLGARDDLVMPYWFAQDAAAAIPNSRLVIYEHGGHMFPETRTSDFLQEVNAFISCP